MKKFAFIATSAALAAVVVPSVAFAEEVAPPAAAAAAPAASVTVNPGRMLFASNGNRVASVYRVSAGGDPQVILNGKLVTVPASTLSDVNGKLTTSLSKAEIGRAN